MSTSSAPANRRERRGFSRLRPARESGFTLIELLVVVIIIAILAAIAVPVYIGIQNNAKKSAMQSDVATTKTNVAAVLAEDGSLPVGTYTNDGTAGGTTKAGDASIQNSLSPKDESVTVTVAAPTVAGGNPTVHVVAKSPSLDYSVDTEIGSGATTVGTAAGSGSGGTTPSTPATVTVATVDGESTTQPAGRSVSLYMASRVTSSTAHSPTHVYRMTGNQGEIDYSFPATDFQAGKTYTFTVWVKGNGPVDTIVNDGQTNDCQTVTATPTWQQITRTYTPPTSGPIGMFFTVNQNYNNSNSTDVDDMVISQN